MKRICCDELFKAISEHRDGLEWTPVSPGDSAGPIVVGWFGKHPQIKHSGFLPAMWCPFCNEEI